MLLEKTTTCCFTGHRPEKLRLGEEEVKGLLRREILRAVGEGYVTFFSGMAPGVDLWAAELVLELGRQLPIRLVCALPYPGFGEGNPEPWYSLRHWALYKSRRVKVISPAYHRGVFQERNRFMVDRSSLLIALYNGAPGGTRNTIEYARKMGIATRIIPSWVSPHPSAGKMKRAGSPTLF